VLSLFQWLWKESVFSSGLLTLPFALKWLIISYPTCS